MTCAGGAADGWTHLSCVRCWNRKWPDSMKLAIEHQAGEAGPCCYCGHETISGIYMRDDPREVHGAAKGGPR